MFGRLLSDASQSDARRQEIFFYVRLQINPASSRRRKISNPAVGRRLAALRPKIPITTPGPSRRSRQL